MLGNSGVVGISGIVGSLGNGTSGMSNGSSLGDWNYLFSSREPFAILYIHAILYAYDILYYLFMSLNVL